MAAGDLATRLRRFATADIVMPVEVAGHPRLLTDPRLLPALCHLFRRVAVVAGVVVAECDGKSFAGGTPDYCESIRTIADRGICQEEIQSVFPILSREPMTGNPVFLSKLIQLSHESVSLKTFSNRP